MQVTLPILVLSCDEPYNIEAKGDQKGSSGRKVRYQIINGDPEPKTMGSAVIEQNVPIAVGAKIPDVKGPLVMLGAFVQKLRRVETSYQGNKRSIQVPVLVLTDVDPASIAHVELPTPRVAVAAGRAA